MPRKIWLLKNPYCKRSKLSEDAFMALVFCYLSEITVGWSLSHCLELLKLRGCGDITRQTVSKYFDKISQFIWDVMIVTTDPIYKNKDALDELLLFMYGKIDKVSSRHNIAYKFLETTVAEVKDSRTPVQRTLMFHLLEKRSQVLKGFPKGKFYLEFSRIFYVCMITEAAGINVGSHERFFEKEIRGKIEVQAWKTLLDLFKKMPL